MLVVVRRPSSLAKLSIALTLAIIAVLGYRHSPALRAEADLTVEPAAACDLHRQACHADLPGGGRIELGLSPHPIPVVKPIEVSVALTGMTARTLEIDFAGVNMDMGPNRVRLAAAGDGRYTGAAMLPVCAMGRMAWRATLTLETEHQRIAIPFLFSAPN